MAENIVAGLFGLTPQMYGEQQRRSALREGIDLAKLTPGEAGAAMTYAGARGLGGAIAGALGVEDPQLKLISTRQQVLGQLDQSDPTSLLNGAKTLAQMGDQQGAFALADFARKAQVQIAEQQQRLAAAKASEAQATRERLPAVNPNIQVAAEIAALKISLKRLEAVPSSPETDDLKENLTYKLEELMRLSGTKQPDFVLKQETLQGLKANLRVLKSQPEPNKEAILRIEDSIQAIEGVPKDPSVGSSAEVVSKELYFKPFSELNQDQVAKVNAEVAKRKKEEIKAGVSLPAQQAKQVMQNKTDLYNEVEKSAYNSSDRVTLARNLKSLLPTAFTGVDSNLKLQASRIAEVFGINIQGVPDSQIIDTILGEMTIGAASKLKGGLSDKDVKFLKETIGTRGLSVRTLEFVANKIEQDALIDGGLNEVVNKFVASGGDLNTFNFASQRKDVAEKVRKDLARLKELREKAKPQ
jgi:hypothetical protein